MCADSVLRQDRQRLYTRRSLLAAAAVLPIAASGCGRVQIDLPFRRTNRPAVVAQPFADFGSDRLRDLAPRIPPKAGVEITSWSVTLVRGDDVPPIEDQYAATVREAIGGRGADLAVVYPSLLPALSRERSLADLHALSGHSDLLDPDKYLPGTLRAGRMNGKQLALPLQFGVNSLIYDPERLRRAGIKPPTTAWTWEQMREITRALTEPGEWGMLVSVLGPSLIELAWQFGSNLFIDDEGASSLLAPPVLEALELLVEMVQQDQVAPEIDDELAQGSTTSAWRRLTYGFGAGQFAMAVAPVAGANWWRRRGSGVSLGIAEPPRGRGAATLATAGLMLGVPTNAPDPRLSIRALEALVEASLKGLWIPARRGNAPLSSIDPALSEEEDAVLMTIAESSRVLPGDAPLDAPGKIFRQVVAPVLSGKASPMQALRDMAAMLQRAADASRG